MSKKQTEETPEQVLANAEAMAKPAKQPPIESVTQTLLNSVPIDEGTKFVAVAVPDLLLLCDWAEVGERYRASHQVKAVVERVRNVIH